MSDYIASKMTADDLFEHIKSRPKMYDIFVELLARAWQEGFDANVYFNREYDRWYADRGHDVTPPEPENNPYKEAPFA